jgi:hypothetical protein
MSNTCTCNVTLRRVHETIVTVEEKYVRVTCFCVRVCGTHGWVRACMIMCVCVGARALACACARVALLIQHATRRHIAICGLSESSIFFDYIIKGTIFGKNLPNVKYVFWVSLKLLFGILFTLRKIQRDIIINVKTSSCKVSVILVRFE